MKSPCLPLEFHSSIFLFLGTSAFALAITLDQFNWLTSLSCRLTLSKTTSGNSKFCVAAKYVSTASSQ